MMTLSQRASPGVPTDEEAVVFVSWRQSQAQRARCQAGAHPRLGSGPTGVCGDLTGMDVVVLGSFPFHLRLPLGDWQLARAFSRLGARVLYIDPPVSLAAPWRHNLAPEVARGRPRAGDFGVAVVTPFSLRGSKPWTLTTLQDFTVRLQVRRWLRRQGFARPLVLTVSPDRGTWSTLRRSSLVYWQKDRQHESPRARRPDWTLRRHEELLRVADVATGVTRTIVADGAKLGVPVTLQPNACDITLFGDRPEPNELADLPHPRLCFVGKWNWRVDSELIADLAMARPDWTLVLVSEAPPVPMPPNVVVLGPRDVSAVPAVLQHCDVGLVPYRDGAFNAASCPLKVYEYLAAALPVVASGIDSDIGEDLVRPATGTQEWVAAVEQHLTDLAALRPRARAFAEQNTWEHRALAVVQLARDRTVQETTRSK